MHHKVHFVAKCHIRGKSYSLRNNFLNASANYHQYSASDPAERGRPHISLFPDSSWSNLRQSQVRRDMWSLLCVLGWPVVGGPIVPGGSRRVHPVRGWSDVKTSWAHPSFLFLPSLSLYRNFTTAGDGSNINQLLNRQLCLPAHLPLHLSSLLWPHYCWRRLQLKQGGALPQPRELPPSTCATLSPEMVLCQKVSSGILSRCNCITTIQFLLWD